MRILVTGAGGFVGQHLVRHLLGAGDEAIATGTQGSSPVDVTDARAVAESIRKSSPDAVVHLAAQPSVPQSWEQPESTYRVNVIGTLNVLRALEGLPSRLLLVGSAQQYSTKADGSALSEEAPMQPNSPYAASKIAAEQLAFLYGRSQGFPVIATRSFNHTGPGQSSHYAIGSFARQIVEIQKGKIEPKMSVGDLSARRDLLDVRDVVQAYRLLLDSGAAGEAYNVCSGVAVAMGDVLETMLKSAGLLGQVEVQADPSGRKGEPSEIVGDPSKLKAATGWEPKIRLETSLVETMDWYRETLDREER